MGIKDIKSKSNQISASFHTSREVASKSVEDLEVEKVFEDGFIDRVSLDRSSYFYWAGLVEKHGAIVDSLEHPKDKDQLAFILAEQKAARDKMKTADISRTKPKKSLADQIQSATSRSITTGTSIDPHKLSVER